MDQMDLIHRHRSEPALPQMPGRAHPRVHIAGIAPMQIPEGAAQPIGVRGRQHDMDVVGHQAIAPHLGLRAQRRVRQQVEIERLVALLEEGRRAPIAPLRQMTR